MSSADIVAGLVVAAIVIAAILIAEAWQELFNPMPESITEARPGTLLVYTIHGAETEVKREYCDTTEGYYIEEMAADRLAERGCVKVELKAMDGKVYSFTRLSIKQRGW
jgi:hypothetical protein